MDLRSVPMVGSQHDPAIPQLIRHSEAHQGQSYTIIGIVEPPGPSSPALTVDLFLKKLEDLGPRCGFRLPHVQAAISSSGAEQASATAAYIVESLYECVLDPRWCLRFMPPSALEDAMLSAERADRVRKLLGDDAMEDSVAEGEARTVKAPTVTSDFTLRKLQEESGEPEYSESRRGKACGHVFKQGEGVWHCVDCALDATCVLCHRCFRASDHSGHAVSFSAHSAGVGCCDCGDPEAWKLEGGLACGYHSPHSPGHDTAMLAEVERDPQTKQLSSECRQAVERSVRLALDFIDRVLARAPDVIAPPEDAEAIQRLLSRKEEEAQAKAKLKGEGETTRRQAQGGEPMRVDTTDEPLASSFPAFRVPQASPTSSSRLRSFFSPSRRTSDKGKGKSGLASPEAPVTSDRRSGEASGKEVVDPKGSGPWTAILWNDEKHSYAQVISKVAETTKCTNEAALRVAQRVDVHGRDVLTISSDTEKLASIARSIASITLGVTIRPALDAFVEMVADLCVDFLLDLASCRVYDVDAEEESFLGQTILRVLCEPIEPLGERKGTGGWRRPEDGSTRFERLLMNDSKLWKEPRGKLKSLYIKLIGLSTDAKRGLGTLFAKTYPMLAEDYFGDREPEYTILDLSLQILTVPSVSRELVANGFLVTVLDVLYALFTDQFIEIDAGPGARKYLAHPVDYNVTAVDLEGSSIKYKRHLHLFNELNYLLSSPGTQSIVATTPQLVIPIARFLDLFTNMNPTRRAADAHVEYENDVWVAVFNLTIQLARLARSVGGCFSQLPALPAQQVGPGEGVFAKQAKAMIKYIYDHSNVRLHGVGFGGDGSWKVEYEVVAFKTESEPVSFHHPLNWTLAEILRHSIIRPGEYRLETISELFEDLPPGTGPLVVAENVIRVMALIAQIRAGLWVRNGFGLRAQHLHYRDAGLRENTFDQDLFLIQAIFAGTDPNHVLVALIDRFGLSRWFADDGAKSFELMQIVTLLEELLWLVTVVVSEPLSIAGWTDAQCLKREVMHVLSLGPLPHTDIEKRVPDRLADESSNLDDVLKEVADFKVPAGINDVGMYSLRPQYLPQVDPFFYRFSRNQREECDRLVIAQIRRVSGEPNAVQVPQKSPIEGGPFASLPLILTSEVLLHILFACLARFHPQSKAYSENLADQAIHLVMLGIVEQSQTFARLATSIRFPLEGGSSSGSVHRMTLCSILQAVEKEATMASLKPKVSWCLDQIGILLGNPRTIAAGGVKATSGAAPGSEDSKKATAKARQAAIMQQMAAQQQQALANLDDYSDEDEEIDKLMDSTTETSNHGQCIVCQDELHDGDAFGILAFIQTSRLIRCMPPAASDQIDDWLCEALEAPESLDVDGRINGPFGVAGRRVSTTDEKLLMDSHAFAFPGQDRRGLYTSACGHLMHLSCFQTYYESVKQRHQTQVTRNHPENIERFEFLCPLCRSLGNVLLPHAKGANCVPSHPIPPNLESWLTSPASVSVSAYTGGLPFDAESNTLESWIIDEVPIQRGASTAAATGVSKSSAKMLERFATVTRALNQEVDSFKSEYDESDNATRRPSIDEDVLAYTIAGIEIASRGQLQIDGVASSLSDPQRRMLHALFGVLRSFVCIASGSSLGPNEAAAILAEQFYVQDEDMAQRKPHLLRDPLAALVQICAVSPDAFGHAVSVCYYLEVLRVTFGLARLGAEHSQEWWRKARTPPPSGAEDVGEGQLWRNLVVRFFGTFANPWENSVAAMDDFIFQKLIWAHTLPFLRRASIIQSIISDPVRRTGRILPEALESSSEHERLRYQLAIPPVSDVFATAKDGNSDPARQSPLCMLMMRWLNHLHRYVAARVLTPSVYKALPRLEHPGIYELVGLPHNYNDLVAEAAQRKCPRCNMVPSKPCLCLFCGAIVCIQSYCCMSDNIADNPEHGECNMHMWSCRGSVGVYLSVTECAMIYLATQNGAITTAPYLNKHGETNVAMRRSRPQYLHRPRWDEVRKLWLNHMIPTFVARKQDATTDAGGWPTM